MSLKCRCEPMTFNLIYAGTFKHSSFLFQMYNYPYNVGSLCPS